MKYNVTSPNLNSYLLQKYNDLGPYILLHNVCRELVLGVKRLGRGADYSPPSSAEVKNGGVKTPLSHKS
jgi:hypothetical protein